MAIRAFILEDDFLLALDLREALMSQGCEVVGVADSVEAALPFLEQDISLAFVDFNLSDGFIGPQIAYRLMEKGVRTICVTANPNLLSQVEGWAAPFYPKPLSEDAVFSIIKETLKALDQQEMLSG